MKLSDVKRKPVCKLCGKQMTLLDEERGYCYKDDLIYYVKELRWSDDGPATSATKTEAGPPAPPVGTIDVWVPIVLLLAMLLLSYRIPFAGVGLFIVATLYVHYSSKKFKIGGGRAFVTLLFAIVGLPLFAYDLHKLKQHQRSPVSQPLASAGPMPTVAKPAQVTVPEAKFCRECGAKIPRDSMFCEECGTKLS